VALAAVPAQASAHATVLPAASRPADVQNYRVTVPNEADTDTTEVRLRIPDGFDFVLADLPPESWEADLLRKGGKLREIRWHGGRIPPGFYATFRFLARNPVEEGEVRWAIVQSYENGDVVRWIGPEGSEEPASVTEIDESATPVDTVSVHSGQAASGPAPGTAPAGEQAGEARQAAAPGGEGGSDGPLAIVLAGAALAAALAALAVSMGNRRAVKS
jgi:uncharacterized protein YcnI